MSTISRRLDRIAAAILLIGYGAWIGALARDATMNAEFPPDAWLGRALLILQAVPCIVLGVVVSLDALAAGRYRLIRWLADIAVAVGAWLVMAFGVFVAIADIVFALRFFAVGALLIGTLFLGRLRRPTGR
jgi:hypothetical protein